MLSLAMVAWSWTHCDSIRIALLMGPTVQRNLLPNNLEGSDIGSRTELSEKQGNREILKNVTLWIEQQREKKQIEWRGSF